LVCGRAGRMLKLTTWNVNGIRARERDVLEWIARERPDVLCLQEVKASPEHVPEALCELPDYWCYWHGHKGYSGVALHLSRRSFPAQPQFEHPAFDHETRIVTARVGDLLMASIYVPNGGKDFSAKIRFLDALDELCREAEGQASRLLLAGDLNVAREERDVHPTLRKPEQIGQTPGERAQLERIIGRGLVDLSRRFQPDEDNLFTWWAPWRNMREKNIGWRLDYILASAAIAERSLKCVIAKEFGSSDHAPVTALLDIDVPTPPGSAGGGPPGPRGGRRQLSLLGV
jgi:exodeoxyribonuclease III